MEAVLRRWYLSQALRKMGKGTFSVVEKISCKGPEVGQNSECSGNC